jgi:hypothetical protein
MHILEELARVQSVSEGCFTDVIRQGSLGLAWGDTLVAITGRLDPALSELLLQLKRSGYAVALIHVSPGRAQRRSGRLPNLPGVPVHRVWTDLDLVSSS